MTPLIAGCDGFLGSIGVILHVTRRVRLRPRPPPLGMTGFKLALERLIYIYRIRCLFDLVRVWH